METDYSFRKKYIFIFHFFLKVEPTISSSGRLISRKILIITYGTDFSSRRNLL